MMQLQISCPRNEDQQIIDRQVTIFLKLLRRGLGPAPEKFSRSAWSREELTFHSVNMDTLVYYGSVL